MRFQSLIVLAILFSLVGTEASLARHLGTVGRVYPVVEPDALAEIRSAAARVDWEKAIGLEKMRAKIRGFHPVDLYPLPAAREDRTFLVDMTYTLESDIPDGMGSVLYPKGYSFNPLDYVKLTSVLVVIDAGDKRQVDWFKASPHAGDYRTRLLISGGDYYELAEQLKQPVFYLMDGVAERLHLAAVPSVIRQNDRKLEVTEVLVPHE